MLNHVHLYTKLTLLLTYMCDAAVTKH